MSGSLESNNRSFQMSTSCQYLFKLKTELQVYSPGRGLEFCKTYHNSPIDNCNSGTINTNN